MHSSGIHAGASGTPNRTSNHILPQVKRSISRNSVCQACSVRQYHVIGAVQLYEYGSRDASARVADGPGGIPFEQIAARGEYFFGFAGR